MTKFDRNHPLYATVKNRYLLTHKDVNTQTWHVTLNVTEPFFEYFPGDSIGICPQNDPILVERFIKAMQGAPHDLIVCARSGERVSLSTFLFYRANLSRVTSSFLKLLYEYGCKEDKRKHLERLLENKDAMRAFLAQSDPLFLLRNYAKNTIPLQKLCDQFSPLLPRFYSIASSKYVQKDTIDLTVALFTWMKEGEERYGVASHFLCHLAEIGKTPVPIFVQPARHFRLPRNHDTDIIMIGPGTGIAPFRAFMQERKYHKATGKHWLFFGERHREGGFFYEKEWESHENLRVHTAFSRDQKEKVYVQHKLLENAAEIYSWLKNGAYLYVCGDAKEMAKDVEKALLQVIGKHGNLEESSAKSHLKNLKKEGRYLLDIY